MTGTALELNNGGAETEDVGVAVGEAACSAEVTADRVPRATTW